MHRSAEGTKAEVDWKMVPKLKEICHLSAHLFHFYGDDDGLCVLGKSSHKIAPSFPDIAMHLV